MKTLKFVAVDVWLHHKKMQCVKKRVDVTVVVEKEELFCGKT
jgi:hypothetical protein